MKVGNKNAKLLFCNKEKAGFNLQNTACFRWEYSEDICFYDLSPLSSQERRNILKLVFDTKKMEPAQGRKTNVSMSIRGWPLRVPATNGYPPIFGGRTLPYPTGIAILTGTRLHGYPDNFGRLSLFQWHNECRYVEWRNMCTTAVRHRNDLLIVQGYSFFDGILKPPDLAF